MTFNTHTVTVNFGQRRYDIHIGHGLIEQVEILLAPHLSRGRTVVISDENVAAHHAERLTSALRKIGITVDLITVTAGEASKSFQTLAGIIDQLLALELDRGDVIIAFGGGVIGDLVGFAAAIYKRGIDFIQIPTTLLAQVDSSVGGKTAIDTPRGKNLVGAFHQPRAVIADLDILSTLDDRQMRAGYAEIVKSGLLGDAEFFSWLEKNGPAVLAHEKTALVNAVQRAVQMKADIVMEDEREQGRRALLNLGHTFAHALEAETGLGDVLLHGEAVALGCALAFRFSVASGLCEPGQASRVEHALAKSGLPVRLSDIAWPSFSSDRLVAHMAQDKKAEAGAITLILTRSIGDAFIAKNVDRARLQAFLTAEGAA